MSLRRYPMDYIDGRPVEPLVIDQDYVLHGTHQGTVHVEAGEFTLAGTLQGTLDIHEDVTATILGTQQGTVSVARGATVAVVGAIEGTVSISHGAVVIVEATGKLAGTLANDGRLLVRGVFGGARSGTGRIILEGNGHIKRPLIREGVQIYEWP